MSRTINLEFAAYTITSALVLLFFSLEVVTAIPRIWAGYGLLRWVFIVGAISLLVELIVVPAVIMCGHGIKKGETKRSGLVKQISYLFLKLVLCVIAAVGYADILHFSLAWEFVLFGLGVIFLAMFFFDAITLLLAGISLLGEVVNVSMRMILGSSRLPRR